MVYDLRHRFCISTRHYSLAGLGGFLIRFAFILGEPSTPKSLNPWFGAEDTSRFMYPTVGPCLNLRSPYDHAPTIWEAQLPTL